MPYTPQMEPMLPSEAAIGRSNLCDLALELERKASALSGRASPHTHDIIEDHLRVINSYYSNLIEGHDTRPAQIREAMRGNYDANPAARDLQMESLAHIGVQDALRGRYLDFDQALSRECLRDIHRQFYAALPDSLREVKDPETGNVFNVTPGAIRARDVSVGDHTAPPHQDIPLLLTRFEEAYSAVKLRGIGRVIGVMAAHHRLVWIHPFTDGNGRAARLHTDTLLKAAGVGAIGMWSLSRGLSRTSTTYKSALANADHARKGDSDGRGALSESALVLFCEYMLQTAIDQVEYMASVLDLRGMYERIDAYIRDRNSALILGLGPIKPQASQILKHAFSTGEFPRNECSGILGLGDSVSRKLVQQLKKEGLLSETTSRSPLRWAIPEHAERYYFPDLAV